MSGTSRRFRDRKSGARGALASIGIARARAWLIASLLGASSAARAASFDCQKATTAIEKRVCSDAQVSELDGKLAAAYRRALAVAGSPDSLKAEQRSWLNTERAKCADDPCLREAYQRRLIILSNVAEAGFAAAAGAEASYSFTKVPFINPRLVEDLSTWESDLGNQVIAINVNDSQRSNRYSSEPEVRRDKGASAYVFHRDGQSEFGYRHVGRTTSGVDVLLTMSSGGGSGVFENLMLVVLNVESSGISPDLLENDAETVTFKQRRLVIRKLGELGLGDRWAGDLKVVGNEILIGKNTGLDAKEGAGSRRIRIDYQP
ncbi:MAG TPA: lysozyme inhibitor LprI family protein [Polyangia bacterium]|jgi:uncharacterized protein|nr:lysozyme inhibitor LprI family protein [Polyangia bacterium]